MAAWYKTSLKSVLAFIPNREATTTMYDNEKKYKHSLPIKIFKNTAMNTNNEQNQLNNIK